MRPFQWVWGNRGKRAFISGEQRPNFEGNNGHILRGTKYNIGEQGTFFFDFWGTGEQANLFQGNKGTGTLMGGPL